MFAGARFPLYSMELFTIISQPFRCCLISVSHSSAAFTPQGTAGGDPRAPSAPLFMRGAKERAIAWPLSPVNGCAAVPSRIAVPFPVAASLQSGARPVRDVFKLRPAEGPNATTRLLPDLGSRPPCARGRSLFLALKVPTSSSHRGPPEQQRGAWNLQASRQIIVLPVTCQIQRPEVRQCGP